jgi:hypothetical protein
LDPEPAATAPSLDDPAAALCAAYAIGVIADAITTAVAIAAIIATIVVLVLFILLTPSSLSYRHYEVFLDKNYLDSLVRRSF